MMIDPNEQYTFRASEEGNGDSLLDSFEADIGGDSDSPDKNTGFIGDAVDAATGMFLDSVGGIVDFTSRYHPLSVAEKAIEESTGVGVPGISDTHGALSDALYSAGDWARETISARGNEARKKQLFVSEEDSWKIKGLGDAWSDPYAMGMQAAQVLGALPATMMGGALPGVFGKVGLALTNAASPAGMGGQEAFEEVVNTPFDQLLASEAFKAEVKRIHAENPNRDSLTILKAARINLARAAEHDRSTNPIALATNGLLGMAGDKFMLGRQAVGDSLGKKVAQGMTVEGITELPQESSDRLAQNMTRQEFIDPNQNVWEGTLADGLTGMVLGGKVGGGIAAGKHFLDKRQPIEAEQSQPAPEQNTPTAPTTTTMGINPADLPMMPSPVNPVTQVDIPPPPPPAMPTPVNPVPPVDMQEESPAEIPPMASPVNPVPAVEPQEPPAEQEPEPDSPELAKWRETRKYDDMPEPQYPATARPFNVDQGSYLFTKKDTFLGEIVETHADFVGKDVYLIRSSRQLKNVVRDGAEMASADPNGGDIKYREARTEDIDQALADGELVLRETAEFLPSTKFATDEVKTEEKAESVNEEQPDSLGNTELPQQIDTAQSQTLQPTPLGDTVTNEISEESPVAAEPKTHAISKKMADKVKPGDRILNSNRKFWKNESSARSAIKVAGLDGKVIVDKNTDGVYALKVFNPLAAGTEVEVIESRKKAWDNVYSYSYKVKPTGDTSLDDLFDNARRYQPDAKITKERDAIELTPYSIQNLATENDLVLDLSAVSPDGSAAFDGVRKKEFTVKTDEQADSVSDFVNRIDSARKKSATWEADKPKRDQVVRDNPKPTSPTAEFGGIPTQNELIENGVAFVRYGVDDVEIVPDSDGGFVARVAIDAFVDNENEVEPSTSYGTATKFNSYRALKSRLNNFVADERAKQGASPTPDFDYSGMTGKPSLDGEGISMQFLDQSLFPDAAPKKDPASPSGYSAKGKTFVPVNGTVLIDDEQYVYLGTRKDGETGAFRNIETDEMAYMPLTLTQTEYFTKNHVYAGFNDTVPIEEVLTAYKKKADSLVAGLDLSNHTTDDGKLTFDGMDIVEEHLKDNGIPSYPRIIRSGNSNIAHEIARQIKQSYRADSAPTTETEQQAPAQEATTEAPKVEAAPEAEALTPEQQQLADLEAEEKALFEEYKKFQRESKGRLNSGIPPELVMILGKLGVIQIKKGAIKFKAWAKSYLEAAKRHGVEPAEIADYLKSTYGSMATDPRKFNINDEQADQMLGYLRAMRDLDISGLVKEVEENSPPVLDTQQQNSPPAQETQQQNATETATRSFTDELNALAAAFDAAPVLPTNNNELKKFWVDTFGNQPSGIEQKRLQEAFEAFLSQRVRNMATQEMKNGADTKTVFDDLVAIYNNQPRLNMRSADSSDLQQYSTPAPLSFIANIAAGIDSNATVFEPTAGNGMLLSLANPSNTFANELSDSRRSALEWQGFVVTDRDAQVRPMGEYVTELVDAVVANPPFGRAPAPMQFNDPVNNKQYQFTQIDHIIAANALSTMKDNGKAVLIIGSNPNGKVSGAEKNFLNYVYQNYHVAAHAIVDGKLYQRQGATWNVQVIAINTRATSGTGVWSPIDGTLEKLTSWDQVYEKFSTVLDTDQLKFDGGRKGASHISERGEASNAATTNAPNSNPEPANSGRSSDAPRSDRGGESRAGSSDASVIGGGLAPKPDSSASEVGANDNATRSNSRSGSGSDSNATVRNKSNEPVALPTEVTAITDTQAEYFTGSTAANSGIRTPVSMAAFTQAALADLIDRVGSLDVYVQRELNYASIEEMHKSLMGLQIDAVAAAIDAYYRGEAIIIADQTGTGKGRQGAAMIRFAKQKGLIPVFVTEKPNLFSDMDRDLNGINTPLKPFILNTNESVKREDPSTGNLSEHFKLKPGETKKVIKKITDTGRLPGDYDVIFMTYSQISGERSGTKARMLSSVTKNAFFIMDEAHTAAGTESKAGIVFQNTVMGARGVTYLSATYAKKPENMFLYSRTALGKATETLDELIRVITTGGLQMQTFIANRLAEAGQLFRRERSWEGITIDNTPIHKNKDEVIKTFDKVTAALRALTKVSAAMNDYVETVLEPRLQQEEGVRGLHRGEQQLGVTAPNFASKTHNYIAQLTLALKAQTVADLVIAELEKGERKIWVALSNTMEAALSDFVSNAGLRKGDSLADFSYADILQSALDNLLTVNIDDPNSTTGEEKRAIPLSDIDSELVKTLYAEAQVTIEAIRDIDLPASPIDFVRNEIQQAGFSIAEISGRQRVIDYADNKALADRDPAEQNRVETLSKYNNGQIDVIIANRAGAVGLSAHSDPNFGDTRPRHMIVWQADLDINIYTQMLGRINRHGQISPPSFQNIWLDIPSEMRPAAVLAQKMNSLSANTSGSTETDTKIKTLDMFNVYGDAVVLNYIEENQMMFSEYAPAILKNYQGQPELARWFFGKVAIMPNNQQVRILSDIEEAYTNLIEYLDSIGENNLNTTVMDLEAQAISQKQVVKQDLSRGVFGDGVYLTKAEIKAVSKAPKWADVEKMLADSSQSDHDQIATDLLDLADKYAAEMQTILENAKNDLQRKPKDSKFAQRVSDIAERISGFDQRLKVVTEALQRGVLRHGAFIHLKLDDVDQLVSAVVVGVEHKNGEVGNPLANSKFRIKVAVAHKSGVIPFNLSAIDKEVQGLIPKTASNMAMTFDMEAEKPQLEERFIVTGNLAEGQAMIDKKGRIAPMTTRDGRTILGMLLPGNFSADQHIAEKVDATPEQLAQWLINTDDNVAAAMGIQSLSHAARIKRVGANFTFDVPRSVSKGKGIWGSAAVEDVIGKQAFSGGGIASIPITESQVLSLINAMQNIDPMGIRNRAQAQSFTGQRADKGFSSRNIKFSVAGRSDQKPAKSMKAEAVAVIADAWLQNNTAGNVTVTVIATQGEAEALTGKQDGVVHSFMIDDQIYLVAENLTDAETVRLKLAHEIIAHYGFSTLAAADQADVLSAVEKTKNNPAFAAIWADVESRYSHHHAEEVLAVMAEMQEVKGAFAVAWNAIVAKAIRGLRNVGVLNKNNISKAEAFDLVRQLAKRVKTGNTPTDPSGNRRRFSTNNQTPSDPQKSFLDKIFSTTTDDRSVRQKIQEWASTVRQGSVDRFDALLKLDRAAGIEPMKTPELSFWVAARLAQAGSGAFKVWEEHGEIQWQDGVLQPVHQGQEPRGFHSLLRDLAGTTEDLSEVKRFFSWLVAHRAYDLGVNNPNYNELLFDADEIEAGMALNEGTTSDGRDRVQLYVDASRKFRSLHNSILTVAHEAGIISDEAAEVWSDSWYVPFARDLEPTQDARAFSDGLTRNDVIKKIKGSERKIGNVVENYMQNINMMIEASLRNRVAQDVFDILVETDVVEKIPAYKKKSGDLTTHIMQNGKKTYYKFHSDKAITNQDGSVSLAGKAIFDSVEFIVGSSLSRQPLVRLAQAIKQLKTKVVTASPAFITRNAARDTLMSAAVDKHGGRFLKGLELYGKSSKMNDFRAKMLASGGGFFFGAASNSEVSELSSKLTNALSAPVVLSADTALERVKNGTLTAYNEYSAIGSAIENANRAAIFDGHLAESGNLKRAAFYSRDLMDYTSHGSWQIIRYLISTTSFINARIQGFDKTYRTLHKGDRKRMGVVMAGMAVASALLHALNGDDEDYKKLENWQRDTFWRVPLGDTAWFFPKPFEYSFIPSLTERFMDLHQGNGDVKDVGEFLAEFMSTNVQMTPVPDVAMPFFEIAMNKDLFRDRPIESMQDQKGSPTMATGSKMSSPSKVAQATSTAANAVLPDSLTPSPPQIDHVLNSYFGWLSRNINDVIDLAVDSASGKITPKKHWYENHLISWAYQDLDTPTHTRYMSEFYDLLEKSSRFDTDYRRLIQRRDLKGVAQYKRDHKTEIEMARELARVSRAMAKRRSEALAIAIDQNNGLSAIQRRERLESITKELNDLAKRAVDRYKNK